MDDAENILTFKELISFYKDKSKLDEFKFNSNTLVSLNKTLLRYKPTVLENKSCNIKNRNSASFFLLYQL